jgi:hypothetical protein
VYTCVCERGLLFHSSSHSLILAGLLTTKDQMGALEMIIQYTQSIHDTDVFAAEVRQTSENLIVKDIFITKFRQNALLDYYPSEFRKDLDISSLSLSRHSIRHSYHLAEIFGKYSIISGSTKVPRVTISDAAQIIVILFTQVIPNHHLSLSVSLDCFFSFLI